MSRGFDADERAKAREEGPVKIGGVTYHARRLTNRRLREIRRLSRDANKEAREAARQSEDYRLELEDARRDGASEEEVERRALDAGMASEEVDAINTASLAKQLPLLLVDDGMQAITEDAVLRHLDEDLDTRDVGELMSYLLGPGKEEQDPPPGS